MDKLVKRLKKTIGDTTNVLVIGTGFGNLEKLIKIADTVFVISKEAPEIKSKNLVYRRNYDDLTPLTSISSIFIDRDHISDIPKLAAIWCRFGSKIIIEDPRVIDREFSKQLYMSHWEPSEQTETFHIWKKKE